MRIASRADHVHVLWPALQRVHHFRRVQHFVADGVINLVQHHQVVLPAVNRGAPRFPAMRGQANVVRVRLRSADLHEPATHRANLKLVISQHLRCVQLTVVPRTFDELHHQHTQSLPYRAKRRAQRASGLTFARPGINNQQSFSFRHEFLPLQISAPSFTGPAVSRTHPQSLAHVPAPLRSAVSWAAASCLSIRSTALAGTVRLPGKSRRSTAQSRNAGPRSIPDPANDWYFAAAADSPPIPSILPWRHPQGRETLAIPAARRCLAALVVPASPDHNPAAVFPVVSQWPRMAGSHRVQFVSAFFLRCPFNHGTQENTRALQ